MTEKRRKIERGSERKQMREDAKEKEMRISTMMEREGKRITKECKEETRRRDERRKKLE